MTTILYKVYAIETIATPKFKEDESLKYVLVERFQDKRSTHSSLEGVKDAIVESYPGNVFLSGIESECNPYSSFERGGQVADLTRELTTEELRTLTKDVLVALNERNFNR